MRLSDRPVLLTDGLTVRKSASVSTVLCAVQAPRFP
uniref:Uncharacterized protein n=1 Tax=Arundo donax TaxID=35708 RepID=A0A0A9GHV7_ARUDO